MMERPPQTPRSERELVPAQAEQIMRDRVEHDLQKNRLPVFTSFALLLDQTGQPVLFERKRPPHEGSYSIVGGKLDALQTPITDTSYLYFTDEGLESPRVGIVRELAEEIYRGQLQSPEDWAAFEQMLHLERKAYVYDASLNALNALYVARPDARLKMELSQEEVGEIKTWNELTPSQINPLSNFFLHQLHKEAPLPDDLQWGRMDHIITPSDILVASQQKPPELNLSHKPRVPAFMIDYQNKAPQPPEDFSAPL